MKPFLSLVSLLSLCQVTFAFDPIVFEASKGTPEEQNWTKNGHLETPIRKEDGRTFLDVDDSNPNEGAAFSYVIDRGTATEADSSGFVFEVHGRIEPSNGPSSQQAEFAMLASRAVMVLPYLDGKQSAGVINKTTPKTVFSHLPGSDFHVWKIVAKPDSDGTLKLSYYADKKLVAGDLTPLDGTNPHLSFGALGGNTASRVGHVLYEKVIFRPLENGE